MNYIINTPQSFNYVGYCIRPPSEANSILIQATLGCSHNKCTFCGSYRDKHFMIKDESILENDLLFAELTCRHQTRIFIMDGDALIMPMSKWEWLLSKIKKQLPWINRVGTYANAKSIAIKSDNDLKQLKKMGLGIVYYGIESGHPQILKDINKGSTADNLLYQGQRIKAAGIKLSVTVLLGIAELKKSIEHAQATGKILTSIDPDYIGALTLMIIPATPLGNQVSLNQFKLPNPKSLLIELREMISFTNLTNGLFYANHASNYLPIKICLPNDRIKALEVIDQAISGKIRLRYEWERAL